MRKTVRAPMRRCSISCCIRMCRTLTIANSAATKKALAATSRTTDDPEQHQSDHMDINFTLWLLLAA